MLPVVWEHHHTLREEAHTTNILVLELGRPGLLDATTHDRTPPPGALSLPRIMQQIQSIDRESRDQPNFARGVIPMWKAAVATIHATLVSDS